jgi:hypothetical protein
MTCWRHDYAHREYVCTCDPVIADDTRTTATQCHVPGPHSPHPMILGRWCDGELHECECWIDPSPREGLSNIVLNPACPIHRVGVDA